MNRLNFARANLRSRVREELRLYGPQEPEPIPIPTPEPTSTPTPKISPASYGPPPPTLLYRGSHEELIEAARRTGLRGRWSESANVKVYRADDGGIMNWAPGTGTIWFQAKRPYADNLSAAITRELVRLGLLSRSKSKRKRERH